MDEEKKEVLPRVESKTLPVKLTPGEIKQRGLELATAVQSLTTIEAEKKTAVSAFKAREDAVKEEIQSLSHAIKSGIEHRSVDCRLDLLGDEVVTTRLDLKEVVTRRPATREDRQQWLFSEEKEIRPAPAPIPMRPLPPPTPVRPVE